MRPITAINRWIRAARCPAYPPRPRTASPAASSHPVVAGTNRAAADARAWGQRVESRIGIVVLVVEFPVSPFGQPRPRVIGVHEHLAVATARAEPAETFDQRS